MFTIYALAINGVPFYVGVTKQRYLSRRLAQHIYDADKNRGKNKQKDHIIKEAARLKYRPSIAPVESNIATVSDANDAEAFYIQSFSTIWPLTNVKQGGYDFIP